jgi:hypothetical protein
LISRPADAVENVHVILYDRAEPALQVAVGIFAVADGRYLRELKPATNENQNLRTSGARN